MFQLYGVIELHQRKCACCGRYHLLYFYPDFTLSTPAREFWLVSSNRDRLCGDVSFDARRFSQAFHRATSLEGLHLLDSSVCLLDVPNRVVSISAEFLTDATPEEWDGDHDHLFYWHQMIDFLVPLPPEEFGDIDESPF